MGPVICLNTNTYHGFSLEDAMAGAHASGISYVELAAVPDWTEHVHPDMSDAELNAVWQLLGSADCRALALGGHSNLTTASGRKHFRANLELAHRMRVAYVVTGTGETHGDESAIGDEAAFANEVAALLDRAAELDLTVALETHGANYATGAQLRAFVERVGRPNLGINYDTGNVIFYANEQPYDDLTDCLDLVLALHLKDKAGVASEWNFPAVGSGDLDLERLGSILTRARDALPLSIEIEFTPGGPADVAVVHDAVNSSVSAIATRLLPTIGRS